MFWNIEPEVPGSLGNKSIIDTSIHPPLVQKLEIVFSGWLGDDIIEVFPCFAVTNVLKKQIESEALSGIQFDCIIIDKSEEFHELFPDIVLPEFYWAKITGKFKESDFFIGKDLRLCISQNAFNLLSLFRIENAVFDVIENIH